MEGFEAAAGFDPDYELNIKYGNLQSIREDPQLHTNHKDVNIYHRSLLQKIQLREMSIEWIGNAHMPAYGLTKVFPGQPLEKLVKHLGLVYIGYLAKHHAFLSVLQMALISKWSR
jgi:hypothetical protein